MEFKNLITISTMGDEIRAAQAVASAKAEDAEATSCMAQYTSKKAKSLMANLDIEQAADRRWKIISYLTSYGHKAEDLYGKTTKQLEAMLKKAS